MKKLIIINFLISFIVVSCDENSSENELNTSQPNTLAIIANDMILPHQGELNGLPPEFDWSQFPRIGWGNNPPSDWSAMIPWGQVYRDSNPITVTNTRVQIRNLKAWFLNMDNIWVEWTSTLNIFGAHYLENYEDDFNIAAEINQEASGGISIKFLDGYNFHFWSADGRISMDPTAINGVWISAEARLIVDNPELEDDRQNANFLLGVGGDYWRDLTATWDNFESNGDIGIGRMKYLNEDWQWFNMHTLSTENLNSFPPPF